ncbi:MAG: T9SS type A sorting domain-containing protein [Bacteroidales bacterium]
MKRYILLFFILIPFLTNAQQYAVGFSQQTWVDTSRSRSVDVKLYYPALIAGEDATIAPDSFPLIIFAHGMMINVDAYQNLTDELVPRGYIMAFPQTEGGVLPNHQAFGQDILFLHHHLRQKNHDSSSFLFHSLTRKTALIGHSMGGGSSFLAARQDSLLTTLVTFAAAETSPSAIAAAGDISIPSLVFAGEDDCITRPVIHQIPLYDSLKSTHKTYVEIENGTHCYFAGYNFYCAAAEITCNSSPDISRDMQYEIVSKLLFPWLDAFLKQNHKAEINFYDTLTASSRLNYQHQGPYTGYKEDSGLQQIHIFPNPATDQLTIDAKQKPLWIDLFDAAGNLLMQKKHTDFLDIQILDPGMYFLKIFYENAFIFRTFIKI